MVTSRKDICCVVHLLSVVVLVLTQTDVQGQGRGSTMAQSQGPRFDFGLRSFPYPSPPFSPHWGRFRLLPFSPHLFPVSLAPSCLNNEGIKDPWNYLCTPTGVRLTHWETHRGPFWCICGNKPQREIPVGQPFGNQRSSLTWREQGREIRWYLALSRVIKNSCSFFLSEAFWFWKLKPRYKTGAYPSPIWIIDRINVDLFDVLIS